MQKTKIKNLVQAYSQQHNHSTSRFDLVGRRVSRSTGYLAVLQIL